MGVTTRSMKKALKNTPRRPESVQEDGPAEASNVVNEDVVQGVHEDHVSANGRDTEVGEALNTNIRRENSNGTPSAPGPKETARRPTSKAAQSTKPQRRVQATSSKSGPDKENSLLDTSSEISSATRIPKGVRLVPRGAHPETGIVVLPKRGREETDSGEDINTTRTDGRRVRRRADKTSATTNTLRAATKGRSKTKSNDCPPPPVGVYCIHALLEVTTRLWEEENADVAEALLELRIPSDFRRREEENADVAEALLELRIPRDFRRREEELNRLERNFRTAEFRYQVRRATPYVFEESNPRNLSVDSDAGD